MELNDLLKKLDFFTQRIPSKHPAAIRALSEQYDRGHGLVRCNPNMVEFASDCPLFVLKICIPNQHARNIKDFTQQIFGEI